jgi:hypothetical protein
MDTSASAGVSVSVAVLFAVFGSLEPGPGVTVAVFVRLAVAATLTVPATLIESWLPAPAAMPTLVNDTLFPDDPFVPQEAVPVGVQVTVTPVIAAGTTSAIDTPVAFDGPTLVTTIV